MTARRKVDGQSIVEGMAHNKVFDNLMSVLRKLWILEDVETI